MERKLVTIRRVDKCWKHPGADALDIEQIGGWECVSRIGTFKEGDLAVYHEIDSFLPITHPAYADMASRAIKWKDLQGAEREGYRVKTMKLRGVVSQGYLLPLDAFPELAKFAAMDAVDLTPEAVDLASLLGVVKWEKIVPMGGAAKGNFPSFIAKSDQERFQNLWNKFGNAGEMQIRTYTDGEGNPIRVEQPYTLLRDADYEVTIKLDGSSMTVYRRDDEFGVCSRNNDLVEVDEGNAFWTVAHKLKLRERMNALGVNFALQGELCGPGIQANRDKLKELNFYVYDIYDIDRSRYLTAMQRLAVMISLNELKDADGKFYPMLVHVPVVETRKFDFATKEDVLAYAEGKSLNKDVNREGVVFKRVDDGDVSFKVISNSYLLKHDA